MNTNQAHHRLCFCTIVVYPFPFFFSSTPLASLCNNGTAWVECHPIRGRGSSAPSVNSFNNGHGLCHSQVRFTINPLYTLNQELKFTDSQHSTWIALAGSIGLVLPSGSSVALLYGFIFCVLCCFCVAASLGELSSIWPTAGGQYHFVYALCTERWRKPMVRTPTQWFPDSLYILYTNK